jgi:hypothetical protein
LSSRAAGSTCTSGPDATSHRGASRQAYGRARSDQEAALRRLRAAFGFVEIVAVVDHEADQNKDDDEAVED